MEYPSIANARNNSNRFANHARPAFGGRGEGKRGSGEEETPRKHNQANAKSSEVLQSFNFVEYAGQCLARRFTWFLFFV